MKELFIKSIIAFFLKLFGKNKLGILTYHRVGSSANAISMDRDKFEQQLIWVKQYFNPVGLADGLLMQKEGVLPRGSIAITVDDGYSDSYETIFPLLKKYDLTATFFISTIGFEQGFLWDERIASIIMRTSNKQLFFRGTTYELTCESDRVDCLIACLAEVKYQTISERESAIKELTEQNKQEIHPQQFLTKKQTVELFHSGMGIGAHTHSHPILLKENNETAFHEIKRSQSILEGIIKKPIEYFAYPNGKFGVDFNMTHVEMVKQLGFNAAFSTNKGILKNQEVDGFKIKRFTPWDETEFKFVMRLAFNYCQ